MIPGVGSFHGDNRVPLAEIKAALAGAFQNAEEIYCVVGDRNGKRTFICGSAEGAIISAAYLHRDGLNMAAAVTKFLEEQNRNAAPPQN